jgi:hypothetical protein
MNPASLWLMLSSHFRASSVHAWHAELVDWQTSAGLLPGTPGAKGGSPVMDSVSCGSSLGGGAPIRSRGSRDRPTTATTETAATAGTAQSAALIRFSGRFPNAAAGACEGPPGQPGAAGAASPQDGASRPPGAADGQTGERRRDRARRPAAGPGDWQGWCPLRIAAGGQAHPFRPISTQPHTSSRAATTRNGSASVSRRTRAWARRTEAMERLQLLQLSGAP